MIKHIFRVTLLAAMLMAVTVIANANNVTYSSAPAGLVSETIGGELGYPDQRDKLHKPIFIFQPDGEIRSYRAGH